MGNPTGRVCSQKSKMNSKNFKQNSEGSRSKHNNYINTLKELAQMLPIPLRTGCKRLSKKEIIFRVLHYIEHLQSSIDTAKSLLQVNSEGPKAEEAEQVAIPVIKRGRREATPRAKKTKPLNVSKKPRKKRCARRTERRSVSRKARKCLPLEAENIPSQVDVHREESVFAEGKKPLVLSSSQKPSPFFPSIKVLVSESHQPTDWNLGSNQQEVKEEETAFSVCAEQVAYNEQYQQKLVHYNSSCEEEDEEGLRANPWLSAQSPVGSTHAGSLQLCSPGTGAQSNSFSDLGLSPSLFSSPSRLLPGHILQGGQEELSPVLFEDVYLSPQSSNFSQTLSGTLLRKSAFSLDHCYLSYNEMGKSNSSPVSRVNEKLMIPNHRHQLHEDATLRPECPMSSSDENSDSTWVPCKRARKPSQVASHKKKKKKKVVRRQSCWALACEKHSSSSPFKLKKKCVNGFIMFCRLNRKHIIRAHPGMASTVATRELAQLWRVMTKQERKPYCLKARRFSLLNNRIVRDDFSSGEDELEPPKPFHLLLAEKSLPDTQFFRDLSLLELIP